MPHNCNLEDVKEIKKIVNIPIVCAGKMTPIVAANAIKNNEIDAMGVARQFLVDKEWVTKLINDKIDEIYKEYGCQVIVNGIFDSLKYYLRLLTNSDEFLTCYTKNLQANEELDYEHKISWNRIVENRKDD